MLHEPLSKGILSLRVPEGLLLDNVERCDACSALCDEKNEEKKEEIARKRSKKKERSMHTQDTRVEADMEFLAKSVCSFEADVELRGSSEVAMLEGLHHPVGKIELILRMCVYVSVGA